MNIRKLVFALRGSESWEEKNEKAYERALKEQHSFTSGENIASFEEEEYGTPGKAPTSTGYFLDPTAYERSLLKAIFPDVLEEEDIEQEEEARSQVPSQVPPQTAKSDTGSEGTQVNANSVVYNFNGSLRTAALRRLSKAG